MCSSNASNPYGGIAQAGANQGSTQPRSKTPTVTMFNKFKYKKALEGYTETARDLGNTWDMYGAANNRIERRPGENWQQHQDRIAAEKSAFESSSAYRAAEGGVEWAARLQSEKNAYVAKYISENEGLDPATGEAWTDHGYGIPPPQPASSGGSSGGGSTGGAPGAPAAPTGPKDVMAARNKEKKAAKAGQSARGRTSLRM